MTMNGAVLPVMALYVIAAEEQGVAPGQARRDHPERHPQGVHGPQHLYLPPRTLHADHRRHLPLHLREDAAFQLHLDLRLPHAGGRGDPRSRARLHPRRRHRVCPHRPGLGSRHRRLRPEDLVLLGDRDERLHGDRQAAGGAAAVGEDHEDHRRRGPQVHDAAHPLADLGLEPDRAGSLQQRRPDLSRGPGRDHGPHPVAAHQLPRRGPRPAHRFLGPDRPQHPDPAPGRERDLPRRRSRGAARTMSSASPTSSPNAPGRTSPRSRSSAGWPRRSRRVCPRCGSKRPPPAPRRGSTRAASPSSGSTDSPSTTRRRSMSSRSTTPRSSRPRSAASRSSAPNATRPPSRRRSPPSPRPPRPATAISSP